MGKPRVHITYEELKSAYYSDDNPSASQVAKRFGCTSTTIKNYLVKYGIPVKSQSTVMSGRTLSEDHKEKVSKTLSHGKREENPNWKGGVTYSGRKKNGLYRKILVDGKYVLEHRYVMEQSLGRKLVKGEEVHHINGNKQNNDISNLILLSKSEHSKLHNNSPSIRYKKSVEMQRIRSEKFWSTRPTQP